MSDWQPIEPAPKNQVVLVCWTHAPDDYEIAVQWDDGSWWQHALEYSLTTPTHWQPLPEAPQSEEGTGS